MQRVNSFFQLDSWRDWLRIFRLPILLASESVKLIMMIYCGCQVNELNNWMSHTIRTPYYWRIARDGTAFVAGPYSPLWYVLNEPARLGYFGWMSYLFIIDLAFSVWVFWKRSWPFIIPYIMGSLYFYNVDPIDLFIFQFSLLGMFTPWMSLFAILFKLPWFPPFSPLYAWSFILSNPYGLNEPGGLARYGQMGLAWIGGVGLYLYRRRQKRIRLRQALYLLH